MTYAHRKVSKKLWLKIYDPFLELMRERFTLKCRQSVLTYNDVKYGIARPMQLSIKPTFKS